LLGGTCVNVGCIPKKLMHHAATIGHHISISDQMGWSVADVKHNWETMVEYITNYIRSLNFSYRTDLRTKGITYIEAEGKFLSPNTLGYKLKNVEHQLSFTKCIVATGGRPTNLNIPGGELAITSDDIFWSHKPPGKTLIIGGGYIAGKTKKQNSYPIQYYF
jgi:thioredoxin reductase (NADPH)